MHKVHSVYLSMYLVILSSWFNFLDIDCQLNELEKMLLLLILVNLSECRLNLIDSTLLSNMHPSNSDSNAPSFFGNRFQDNAWSDPNDCSRAKQPFVLSNPYNFSLDIRIPGVIPTEVRVMSFLWFVSFFTFPPSSSPFSFHHSFEKCYKSGRGALRSRGETDNTDSFISLPLS